jgi:acyl dehydratase
MELSSKYVGTILKDYQAHITWRDTMNCAAAVDDDNPRYFDDTREGGIIAPPMFCAAATWPVLANIDHHLGGSDFPREVLLTLVHYSEHIEFSRPVRPGDTLNIEGMVAAILPHKAGTQIVMRFDAQDHQGNTVFTEHIGGLLRGVRCSDAGKGSDALPRVPDPQNEMNSLWQSAIRIDRLRSFVYDGCTNIVFPIHTSKQFARAVELPDIILQGTATLAFALRDIINREAHGDAGKLEALSCRFTGMVFPGTDIAVRLDGRHPRAGSTDLFFTVLNDEGKEALSRGYVSLRNP